mmetsp:Transcript_90913/g.283239  ORF Transcript_90913/g.283239 Transcript_90913/m.283239 type:complete len:413 (+) Transcript_90913:95-1333(+)
MAAPPYRPCTARPLRRLPSLLLLLIAACCRQCAGLRAEPGRPVAAQKPRVPREQPKQVLRRAGAPPVAAPPMPKYYTGPVIPEGPQVEPQGRHIQWLFVNFPHGLSDRLMYYFQPLVALGQHFNATVHIKGGADGPQLWLHAMHSLEVASSWGRYFDLRANGGNPWHELVNFKGCRKVKSQELEAKDTWTSMFDGGVKCVNMVDDFPKAFLRHKIVRHLSPDVPVSPRLRADAQAFLDHHGVARPYGSIHIRRCDRLVGNHLCTTPEAIRANVAQNNVVSTWLVFMYAEQGYREKLRSKLKGFGRQLLFEDEVTLNPSFPKDNYYTYLMAKYLNGGAGVILETHSCLGEKPRIYTAVPHHGLFLSRGEEGSEPSGEARAAESYERDIAYLSTEEEHEAVCESRPRGAHLLRN